MRKKKKGLQAVGLEPTNPKEWCLKPTRLTTSLHLRNFINKRAPLSGIEPLTLRLTAVRSNQLSYKGFSPKTAIYLTTLYTTWMIFSDPNTVPSAPRIDPTKLHRTTERTLNAFISSYKHKNQTKLKKAIETSWNCAHSFKKLAKCYKYRPGPTLQPLD